MDCLIEFKRLRFSLNFCSTIINKAQEQTKKLAGIENSNRCFTRSQFYVTCSLVSPENNLNI